ncbi:flavin reductase family protein [Nocardia terpenica]|nr:flavin reductase family protein [Nocardia terpenica]
MPVVVPGQKHAGDTVGPCDDPPVGPGDDPPVGPGMLLAGASPRTTAHPEPGGDLRAVMRNFATGVAIATTYVDRPEGRIHDAVTINSLISLSLDPPLIAISMRHGSRFGAGLAESRVWAVSILGGAALRTAGVFAKPHAARAEALDALPTRPGPRTGALLLDAPGWLECVLERSVEVGDHTLFVGEVVAAGAHDVGDRLVFLQGRFHVVDHIPDHRPGGIA